MHAPKIQADAATAIVGGLAIGTVTGVAYEKSGWEFPLGWIGEIFIRELTAAAVTSQASYEDKLTVHGAARAASWITFAYFYGAQKPKTISIVMGTEKIPVNSLQQHQQ